MVCSWCWKAQSRCSFPALISCGLLHSKDYLSRFVPQNPKPASEGKASTEEKEGSTDREERFKKICPFHITKF